MQDIANSRLPREKGDWLRKASFFLVVTAIAAVGIVPAFSGDGLGQRGFLAAVIFLFLALLTKSDPKIGFSATIVYLALMGWLRRSLTPYFDWVDMDPLLLVAPGVAIVFGGGALWRTRGKSVSKMTKLVLALLVLMVLEIVNPLQGGIAVGVIGALFYIIPLLWYFVGRDMVDTKTLSVFLQTLVYISIVSLLYGFYQTWFGFSDTEIVWIKQARYDFILVPGMGRAFSTYPSFAEYTRSLLFGSAILAAGLFFRRKLGWVMIPLMVLGIFLEASRGGMVAVLLVLCVLWAVMAKDRKTWITRGAVAGVVAVVSLVVVLTHVQNSNADAKTAVIVQHQTDGLLNPMDASKSTAGAHGSIMLGGIVKGFTTPIGLGLGSTSLASRKMGNVDDNNSEVDISNVFTSLGFIGGFLYLAFVIISFGLAVKTWHRTRQLVWLSVVGILVVCAGSWLIGGEYTTSMVVWLCLGALDRAQRKAAA